MANLTPTPSWDDVPQLETNTVAKGGAGGALNLQAQALINRSEYLDQAKADLAYVQTQENRLHGVLLMEFGLSLCDRAYSPDYVSGGGVIRWYTDEGPLNWIRRRCKGGFATLRSAGKGGDSLQGGLNRIQADVIDLDPRPDWVLVCLYGNDVYADKDFPYIRDKLVEIVGRLRPEGINVMLASIVANTKFNSTPAWMTTCAETVDWLKRHTRMNNIPYVDYHTPSARPDQPTKYANASISRAAGGMTTVTFVSAHTMVAGDYASVFDGSAAGINEDSVLLLTVADNLHATYQSINTNAQTGTASILRSDVVHGQTIDGTHFNALGASITGLYNLPMFQALFPPVDILSDSEWDYKNMVGSGNGGAAGAIISRGMMTGTTGIKSANPGATLPTGNVATGWDVKCISGAGGTITCAKTPRTEVGLSQQEWQTVDIVAAAEDLEVAIRMEMPKPAAWTASTGVANGAWRRPVVETGFFYTVTNGGTTGATEPDWPLLLGQKVNDGGATWECRLGWMPGDWLWTGAEYWISHLDETSGRNDSLECLSWGLNDTYASAGSILDFQPRSVDPTPLYEDGETGYFSTPEAEVQGTTTQYNLDCYLHVRAGKHVTINLARATVRKAIAAGG